MITIEALNPHGFKTNKFIDANLEVLRQRVQEAEDAWGKTFVINSGLRSDEQQAELVASGKSTSRISKHLSGNAADIQDVDGSLARWVIDNLSIMAKIGLWIEDPNHTGGWVHMQIMPPMSNKRVFIP